MKAKMNIRRRALSSEGPLRRLWRRWWAREVRRVRRVAVFAVAGLFCEEDGVGLRAEREGWLGRVLLPLPLALASQLYAQLS